MNFKKIEMSSVPGQLIAKETRELSAKANSLNIKGNFKGNGLQAGGTFAVEKGGKMLFEHKQQTFGDHPKLQDILNSLGISAKITEDEPSKPTPQCDENASKM